MTLKVEQDRPNAYLELHADFVRRAPSGRRSTLVNRWTSRNTANPRPRDPRTRFAAERGTPVRFAGPPAATPRRARSSRSTATSGRREPFTQGSTRIGDNPLSEARGRSTRPRNRAATTFDAQAGRSALRATTSTAFFGRRRRALALRGLFRVCRRARTRVSSRASGRSDGTLSVSGSNTVAPR